MSRTFKTDPDWVKAYHQGMPEHDHARGECIPDTLGDIRARNTQAGPRRYHTCPRVTILVEDCPGVEHCFNARFRLRGLTALGGNPDKGKVFCGHVHTHRLYNRDVACSVCDIPVVTCEYGWGNVSHAERNHRMHAPSEFRRDLTGKPDRAAERKAGLDARKAWNAGNRLEGEDFELHDWEPEYIPQKGANWCWW